MVKESFLKYPHCPENKVSLCAVGAVYDEVIAALEKENIRVLPIPANPKLSIPVESHADMQIGILKGDRLLVGKGETKLKSLLILEGFTVIESKSELSNGYPQEALLDFLFMGDKLIGKPNILEMNGLLNNSQIIEVKQGYTKCNAAVISKNALITSDPSIAAACKENNIDVLQIRQGHIELSGYNHGFIGGCCGLISADCLAVCGQLDKHPDYPEIKTFLKKYKVSVLTLKKGNLQDIGGILPLKEIRIF